MTLSVIEVGLESGACRGGPLMRSPHAPRRRAPFFRHSYGRGSVGLGRGVVTEKDWWRDRLYIASPYSTSTCGAGPIQGRQARYRLNPRDSRYAFNATDELDLPIE